MIFVNKFAAASTNKSYFLSKEYPTIKDTIKSVEHIGNSEHNSENKG